MIIIIIIIIIILNNVNYLISESGEIKWYVHEKSVKLIENHSTSYEFGNYCVH